MFDNTIMCLYNKHKVTNKRAERENNHQNKNKN